MSSHNLSTAFKISATEHRVGYEQGLIGMLQLWGTDCKSNEMSIHAMDLLYPNHSPFPWCVRFVTFNVRTVKKCDFALVPVFVKP